ncbi:C-type lectin domain family 4 member E-like [Engraulis encrasicolus]
MNWTDSRDACVTMGGHLVILNSQAEMDFIKDKGQMFWIGLTDIEEEDTFHWVDGTFFNKTTLPWLKNQPDNWEDEDCVVISSPEKTLNDAKCHEQRYRICES